MSDPDNTTDAPPLQVDGEKEDAHAMSTDGIGKTTRNLGQHSYPVQEYENQQAPE
jgi:hypothetical protein